MKNIDNIRSLLFIFFLAVSGCVLAQDDAAKPDISVTIHHFTVNNRFQYLVVETKIKIEKKWQPLKGQVLQLYLDSNKAENLITKVQTDSAGKAKAILPAALQPLWNSASIHKFIAVTEGTSKEEETTTESEISQAKIFIDTANDDGSKTVKVQVMKRENNDWLPAKAVDVKIGVRRMGGDLKIGDEETYTTDSLGEAVGEFKLDSLPGDKNGNIVLVAKVEDNDLYGNLLIDKSVPWGLRLKPENNFGERTLWAARGKAPIWLMCMAYSIIAGVWGVVLYLIFVILRIRKLGKQTITSRQDEKITVTL